MKIIVFGKGYVGTQYAEAGIFPDIYLVDADITKFSEVESVIQKEKPDVVINAAGKTNLEWCFENKIETQAVNIVGPLNILRVCASDNITFVQLSSGCIFEGEGKDGKGFTEEDTPAPACFYAETKAHSDQLLVDSGFEKVLILRLRQPFGYGQHQRSIITKISNFHKAITSQQSITFIPDLIQVTKCLLEKNQTGIFNVCNPGTMSPFEIAQLVHEKLGTGITVEAVDKATLDEMDKQAGREHRVDTIVSGAKLEATGCTMPTIQDRVAEVLETYEMDKSELATFAHN